MAAAAAAAACSARGRDGRRHLQPGDEAAARAAVAGALARFTAMPLAVYTAVVAVLSDLQADYAARIQATAARDVVAELTRGRVDEVLAALRGIATLDAAFCSRATASDLFAWHGHLYQAASRDRLQRVWCGEYAAALPTGSRRVLADDAVEDCIAELLLAGHRAMADEKCVSLRTYTNTVVTVRLTSGVWHARMLAAAPAFTIRDPPFVTAERGRNAVR